MVSSTGQCQGNRWVQEIKRASHVLVAFDHDKNYAGSKAAKEWRILVQGAKRLTPWAHDINDMHIQGIDINAWVDVGLEMLHNESLEHGQASAPATQVEDLPEHCFTCGKSVHEYAAEDFYYDAIGKLYCNEHSAIPRELDAWFFGGVA